jgi:hypothetical protein
MTPVPQKIDQPHPQIQAVSRRMLRPCGGFRARRMDVACGSFRLGNADGGGSDAAANSGTPASSDATASSDAAANSGTPASSDATASSDAQAITV